MRIVSVLPSATEIVFALGAGAELVGRSAECDYPAEVAARPVVMRPRTLDADQPSATIDQRVREARGQGESLYELDLARLRELRPDVLLTQDLCGVCSVTDEEVRQACRQAGIAPRIVSLTPRTLADVWATVEQVGEAIGRSPAARLLVEELRSRAAPDRSRASTRVAVVEWLDPPIVAGLWTPAMVRAAGAEPIGPEPGEVGWRSSWSELEALQPDLLVLSPCSFSVERSLRELQAPALRAQVRRVARSGSAWLADEAYFSRPGPRLADGVDLLRALLDGRTGPFPMPARRWSSASTEAAA